MAILSFVSFYNDSNNITLEVNQCGGNTEKLYNRLKAIVYLKGIKEVINCYHS